MELKKIIRVRFIHKTHLLYFIITIIFFSVCALLTSISTSRIACLDSKCSLTDEDGLHNQKIAVTQRRYLNGPGSSPPRCTSKCGKCTPCKPVHVPVPPGTPVTAEYYPEAWRCKCGNKLYMP